jgi:hypothetical protein
MPINNMATDEDHYDVFCEWIRARRFGAFHYHGYYRVVIPAHVGQIADDDLLIAYQTQGSSSSGIPPFWRTFKLNDIQDLRISDTAFEGFPPGFKKNAGRLNMKVCCELGEDFI